jgi:anti-sigma-K factor RskA
VSLSQHDLRVNFRRYITGSLSESDRTRFEEQLLADQDLSDAAAVCEQELIDAYALHRLDAEETRAIGSWIEASPRRLERVAIARALLQATPRRGFRRQQIGVALAAAACLLVAASLYLVKSGMLHRAQTTTQLSAANTPPQNQAPLTTAPNTATPDVVLIAAERIRGEQKTTTYQIHREAPIQLQVLLPSETARSGYQVRVSQSDDPAKTLLQQNDLEAQSMAGKLYLTVTLPPGSLPPATYTASVSRQGNTLVSHFTVVWVHK